MILSLTSEITLIVAFLFVLVQGSESAADGAQCSTDADCANNAKGVVCIKPFADCAKGYCQCPFGEFGNVKSTEGVCLTGDATNEAACDGTKTCNTGAGLTCTTNKCACGNAAPWDDTKKECWDTTNSKDLDEACGADTGICTATSGLVKACTASGNCECNANYKKVDKSCVYRLAYMKDDTCADVQTNTNAVATDTLCIEKTMAYIGGEASLPNTAVEIPTGYECSTAKKCSCPTTGKTVYVKLAENAAFCKVSTGTKNFTDTCTTHDECSSTLACGKCPGDSASKCHKDMLYKDDDSGATVHQITLAAVFVIVGVVQIVKF